MTTEQHIAKLKPLLQSAFNVLSCSDVISISPYGLFSQIRSHMLKYEVSVLGEFVKIFPTFAAV